MASGSEGMIRVSDYGSDEEARAAGASLLESGIVAVVEDDAAGPVGLFVFPVDVTRACELLGVAEPEPVTELPSLEEPITSAQARWRFPRERLGLFILGYLVVLIGLSVIVFFVVYWALGGTSDPEMPGSGF